jgi:hypothetical protein
MVFMTTVTMTEFCASPRKMRMYLQKAGVFAVTDRGQPAMIVLNPEQANLKNYNDFTAQKAIKTLDAIQTRNAAAKFEDITMDEINTEIAAYRAEKRAKSNT